MEAEVQPGAGSRWRRLLHWALDRPLRQVITGIGLFLLRLTAPFGGWAKASEDRLATPVAAVGTAVDAEPVTLTITSAKWSVRPSPSFTAAKDGQAYLIVFAKVSTTWDRPVPFDTMRETVRISGLDGLYADATGLTGGVVDAAKAAPTLYNATDGQPLGTVGPGLAYDGAFVFLHHGRTFPATVTVTLSGHTWRQSLVDGSMRWSDRTPVATVTVPLVHGKEATAP